MVSLHNYKIKHKGGVKLTGDSIPDARTFPDKKLIETEFENGPLANSHDELLRAIITRHEAYEMRAAERALRRLDTNPRKYVPRTLWNFERANPNEIDRFKQADLVEKMPTRRKAMYNTSHTGFLIPDGKAKHPKNAISGHLDMDILFKERKLLDRTPFPQNQPLDKIRRLRHRTGEYQYLDIAGNLGEASHNINHLERFNKRNARSVLKYGKNPVFVNSANAVTLEPLF